MPRKPAPQPAKILLCSWAFSPSIGGIETSSQFLAERMHLHGIHVEVVTQTPAASPDQTFPFPVHRRPSRGQLLALVRSADLVYQNNISLNTLWPLLLAPRPLIVANHTPIDATVERSPLKRWTKLLAMRSATCVSCSQFLADTFPVPSCVIPNPYRSHIFGPAQPLVPRSREFIFVGRLAKAKGLDILLHALAMLRRQSLTPSLTVIGGGGEEQPLRALTAELQLTHQVTFLGPLPPEQIARQLQQHRFFVAPSRRQPAEAFGIVALEAIACGAVPIVADQCGLPEAVGPCGLTFATEDSTALAATLARSLAAPGLESTLRSHATTHLSRFEEATVFQQHLQLVQQALPQFPILPNALVEIQP